jgi:hypothetical protein
MSDDLSIAQLSDTLITIKALPSESEWQLSEYKRMSEYGLLNVLFGFNGLAKQKANKLNYIITIYLHGLQTRASPLHRKSPTRQCERYN